MAELIVPATAAVVSAAAGIVSAAAAAWQSNHVRRKDKIESSKGLKIIYKNLIEITGLLYAIRDDYENALKENGANKNTTETYNNWSGMVKKLKEEVDEITSKYELQSRKLNWTSNVKIGMKSSMKKKSLDANHLCELGAKLGDIFVFRVIKMDAPDIKYLPTFQKQLETLLDLVTNEHNGVKCVRVWGMPGKGKTTIMQNLNNHEKVREYFDFVIWLELSTKKNDGSMSIDQLRREIVERLKLNLEGVGDHEIANTIKEKLKGKRILLLLDDVRKDLKLNEIGIDPNNGNGTKIVLTTTIKGICRSMVDMEIEVKKLPMDEAFKMFKGVMGQSKNKDDPLIDKVIVLIVRYCDGLPFLIEKIANSFKMKDTVDSWSEGYKSLLVWGEQEDDGVILLYKLLNVCFDRLEEPKRNCLLYSAMYPEDCDVHKDCLYDCWAAEDLYESFSVVDSKSLRAYGPIILEHLKNVSLLEECSSRQYVRLHKWIRRAALYRLAFEGKWKHLAETGKSLQQPPKVERWKDKMWISLADNEMEMLPESPECSTLSTLFLQKNPFLKTIPDLFFKYMEKLRVLNMDGTGIKSLPSSMSMLADVKVLYLNGCSNLDVFPSQIVDLKTVEVLDLRSSGIGTIPPEIVNLSLLRRLLVSFPNFDCDDDREIVSQNCNVLSTIPNLEELIIDVESRKHFCNEMQHFVIDKVASTLSLLTTFKFCFHGGVEDDVIKIVACTPTFSVPTAKALKGFLQRKDLSKSKSFQVFIGYSSSSPPQIPNFHSYESYLRYCNGNGSDDTICELLTKTDALELFHLNELEHLSDFGIANLEKVRGCLIGACNQVQAIGNNLDRPILPNLEELYMKMMSALECILKGPIPQWSLYKLRTLKIENCHSIKELLVDPGNATLRGDFLPNLETLILIDMPNLTRICSYNSLDWPVLKKIHIDECPKLIELPFGKDKAKKLESIEAEKIWWDKLTWQDQEVKERLEPLLLILEWTHLSALATTNLNAP